MYDITNIVPYIQKLHRHPTTGEPLELKDVIKLTFHKNADGEYHCPVLNKVFTESTHIVALRSTGNVYCYEARLRPACPLLCMLRACKFRERQRAATLCAQESCLQRARTLSPSLNWLRLLHIIAPPLHILCLASAKV